VGPYRSRRLNGGDITVDGRNSGRGHRAAVTRLLTRCIEALRRRHCRRRTHAHSLTPSRSRRGIPHFGFSSVYFFFFRLLPLTVPHLRCPQRLLAVRPPLYTILPPLRQVQSSNIAAPNPIMPLQQCQANTPHFIPQTLPRPLLTNKISSIF